MPGNFIDTNILVYIASGVSAKADRAEEVVAAGGVVSVQVLNELANVARRKIKLSWSETHTFLSLVRELLVVRPITIETHDSGLALAERYGLSLYDAMIVAAAQEAGCDRLWTEDLQHGMRFDSGLKIVNPFQAAA